MIIIPVLKKYFIFDKMFDLFDYDKNLLSLYQELKNLKKNSYESNYRFIFLHYDTDYYITNQQPGLLLRNLQRILVDLEIPNYFCLILTEQNIQEQLDQIAKEETVNDCSIASIQHNLQDILHKNVGNIDINISSIKKNYICLNRIRRAHRALLFSILKHKNLLINGLISFCTKKIL